MRDDETGYRDDDLALLTCRQCHDVFPVRPDDERVDAPWTAVCDACVRATVTRAAQRDPLSEHLFQTAVLLARTAPKKAS